MNSEKKYISDIRADTFSSLSGWRDNLVWQSTVTATDAKARVQNIVDGLKRIGEGRKDGEDAFALARIITRRLQACDRREEFVSCALWAGDVTMGSI